MDANEFLTKLKASGSDDDWINLNQIRYKYHELLETEKSSLPVNVLCILCRNLDKVPSWGKQVDYTVLLKFVIECIHKTCNLEKADRVKTLACIYHIHKHSIRNNMPVSLELILNLSHSAFEGEVLTEYSKTYWNIIVDRLTYFEKIKINIIKLLPKLLDNIQSVIKCFDTVQFCSNVLIFLLKKLHMFLKEKYYKDLNKAYAMIFDSIRRKNDSNLFKKLTEKDLLDLYVRFNECFSVLAENCLKMNFEDTVFEMAVNTVMGLIGHEPNMYHCLETIHMKLCSLLSKGNYQDHILNNLKVSCQTTERLGYRIIDITYPHINQLLRLFLEHCVAQETDVSTEIQESSIDLTLFLTEKMRYAKPLSKCEKCKSNSGLHDSLRLSFVLKHLIKPELLVKVYPVILKQYEMVDELSKTGCVNYEKYFKKLQIDVHNTAITLNKIKNYETSIKLFDLYLREEFKGVTSDLTLKNISRALYNKSICELDSNKHEEALNDAFLSMIFSQDVASEKYLSLVMDIKAKHKVTDGESDNEVLQMKTVLNVCNEAMECNYYGDMRMYLCNLKYSDLLKHEFEMLSKLWPAALPIAGVWASLHDLLVNKYHWVKFEKEESLLSTLCDIIFKTAMVVKTIHNVHFKRVINILVKTLEHKPAKSTYLEICYACVLALHAEYELAAASEKYGWKRDDNENTVCHRTMQEEYEAVEGCFKTVKIWSRLVKKKEIQDVPKDFLHRALRITQVTSLLLQHLWYDAQALQLAHVCCLLARVVGDTKLYVQNVNTIINYATHKTDMSGVIREVNWKSMVGDRDTLETGLIYLTNMAIYYARIDETVHSCKLIQLVQAYVVDAMQKYTDINLDFAIGRLMEAQHLVSKGKVLSYLSEVVGIQRHYVSITHSVSSWCERRAQSLGARAGGARSAVGAARAARALALWRRARGAAATARTGSAAPGAVLAALAADTSNTLEALSAVETNFQILGLEVQTNVQQPNEIKTKYFKPSNLLETMLDCPARSPTSTYCTSIPGFKMPEFLTHQDCECHSCVTPYASVLTCRTFFLKASMYFRSNEFEIANNYYDGTLKACQLAKLKMENYIHGLEKNGYEKHLLNMVKNQFDVDLNNIYIDLFLDLSFFHLAKKNFASADEYILRVYEMKQETSIDDYLKNDIDNLTIASYKVHNTRPVINISLESNMENLKLTPEKRVEMPTTPTNNPRIPPQFTNKVVDKEELPQRLKITKFKLDDVEPNSVKKSNQFKVPVTKANVDAMTPYRTPGRNVMESFTPYEDPVFTPSTSTKTYKKKLQHNIVKNLESEFSTPKTKSETKKVQSESKKMQSETRKMQSETKKMQSESKKMQSETKKMQSETKKVQSETKKTQSDIKKTVVTRSRIRKLD